MPRPSFRQWSLWVTGMDCGGVDDRAAHLSILHLRSRDDP